MTEKNGQPGSWEQSQNALIQECICESGSHGNSAARAPHTEISSMAHSFIWMQGILKQIASAVMILL